MILQFCTYCGIPQKMEIIEEDQRCENCDNVVYGDGNYIEGQFTEEAGNKLLGIS